MDKLAIHRDARRGHDARHRDGFWIGDLFNFDLEAEMVFDACRREATGVTCFECFSTRSAAPFYRALGFRPIAEFELPMTGTVSFPSIHMTLAFQ
jgi:hypothetical protein